MTEFDAARDRRIEAAERWCKRVRQYRFAVEREEDACRAIRERMDGLGAVRYDRDGGRSHIEHGDDRMAETLERMAMANDRAEQAMRDWIEEFDRFERCLDRMDNQAYALMLSLRYAHGLEWGDIAKRVPYTYHHLCGYAREAALEQLHDVMPEGMMVDE